MKNNSKGRNVKRIVLAAGTSAVISFSTSQKERFPVLFRGLFCRSVLVTFVLFFAASGEAAVTVVAHLDRDRATSAVIPTTGGTLVCKAADGTEFTLTIPANGLLSSERITMTPVAFVERLPMSGGLVAAVQLEPEGLQLWQPATLTLKLIVPVSPAEETPIAWLKSGEDFHLAPLLIDPSTITFKLVHFSADGLARGNDADRATQQQNPPRDAEAALEQRLAEVLEPERARQLQGLPPDPNLNQAIISVLRDTYTTVIQPMMNSALQSKNDAELRCALRKARAWQRHVQILGITAPNDPFFENADRAIDAFTAQALKILSDNSFKRCVDENKIQEIRTLLTIERQAQLLGTGISETLGTQEKVDKCGNLELVYESNIEHRQENFGTNGRYVETYRGRATVPLKIDVNGGTSGSAPLDYQYTYQLFGINPECTHSGSGQGGTFRVIKIEADMNDRDEDECTGSTSASPGRRRSVGRGPRATAPAADRPFLTSMNINPGQTQETITAVCPGFTDVGTSPNGFLVTIALTHQGEYGVNGLEIRDWSLGTGSLLARKTYQQQKVFGNATYIETTTLDLFHRPGS